MLNLNSITEYSDIENDIETRSVDYNDMTFNDNIANFPIHKQSTRFSTMKNLPITQEKCINIKNNKPMQNVLYNLF